MTRDRDPLAQLVERLAVLALTLVAVIIGLLVILWIGPLPAGLKFGVTAGCLLVLAGMVFMLRAPR